MTGEIRRGAAGIKAAQRATERKRERAAKEIRRNAAKGKAERDREAAARRDRRIRSEEFEAGLF